MANYKLTTATPTQDNTSFIAFTASATDTIITSIVGSDSATSTLEALIKKSGTGTPVIELAHKQVQTDKPEELLTAPVALEAGDVLYVRTSRAGANFLISLVEDTDIPNDTALGGLADVSTSGVTDGQSLVYSTTSSQWEPATVSGGGGGGATDLDGLSDVAITSSTSGDFLKHNGTNYVDVNFDAAVNANATVIANSAKVEYSTALFDADFATKDADDIDDASTTNHRFVTPTQQTTLGNLAPVTTALDLEDMADDIAVNNTKTSYTDAAAVAANTLKNSYPSADASKLAGIAAGATANDTDANLKNRGNHTGTQTSSTISDFTAETETIIADVIGNTDDVSEGITNLYHTNARVDARIGLAKIEDLDEVSSTAPATGEVLKWNGTAWAPAADSTGSGGSGSTTIAGLTDVDITGLTDGHYLVYDDDDEAWRNQTPSVAWTSVTGKPTTFTPSTHGHDADEIDDASTAHKFVTSGDVTKLGNITIANPLNLDTMNTLILSNLTTANGAQSNITSHEASLRNHSDIDYTQANPANIPAGSFLTWDGTTQWIDSLIDLQDLNNVDTPTIGEFLKWNGSTWETDAVSVTPTATIQDADTALTSAGDFEDGARLMKLTNTNTTLVAGKVFKLGASGWDASTNATEAGSTGLMAMCSSTATTGSSMILEGVCRTRLSISAASIGDPIYLGTGDEFTLTAPTSAATVLQLGTVVDPTSNMIYFNPDKTTITIQ